MFKYYLDLIGFNILLKTPINITVSERLSPFLTAPFSAADFAITLCETESLPNISGNGFSQGLSYFDKKEAVDLIFHFENRNKEPFAVTEFCDDGNIKLSVLSGYMHYFSGSSGIFNRIGIENLLLKNNGLLVHSSFIEYRKKGILFMGASGVGKSTQARLWSETLGAEIINGDRAALRQTDSGFAAFGSPYAGTSGIYKNKSAMVAAAVVLKQSKANKLTRLSAATALRLLYPEISIHRWDKDFVNKATSLFLSFAESVPIYLLECTPTKDAVILLKEELKL